MSEKSPERWEWVGSDLERIPNYPGPAVMEPVVECGPYCQGGWVKLKITDADRALIAAAPQLRDALVEAESALAIKASLRDGEQARVERAVVSARRALSAARGQREERHDG